MSFLKSNSSSTRYARWSRRLLMGTVPFQIFLLFACKPGIPNDVIPADTLEDLLYDFHKAQAMAEQASDSITERRYLYTRKVFEKYGVTEAEFDSSMVWYSANASYLADIYKRISERYATDAALLGVGVQKKADRFGSLGSSGDTANIWSDRNFVLLRTEDVQNIYHFSMAADTSFYAGDDFLWQFDARFLYEEGVRQAYAALTVCYDNDSVASVYRTLVSTQSTIDLEIKNKGKERIKSLNGFVYLVSTEKQKKDVFRLMVLNNFRLVRFHKPQEKPDSVPVAPDTVQLAGDSLLRVDSVKAVSRSSSRGDSVRLTPQELRDGRDVERTIRVVKEKPYRRTYSR